MSFLTKKTYKKENKAGATSSSSMDQTLGNFKGSLPYDAQYVGTFQPLLGWRSKTTKDWINNQVGAALNSLQKLIKSESQLLKGTVFKGGFSDPAPELLYNPAYRWMRSALILDEGKFLKDLSEKLALKKVGPQIADTLARFIKTCLQDNQPVINPILEKNAKVLLELLVGLKIVNMPANYFKRALEDRSNHYLKVLNWIARLQLSDGSVSREEELKLSPIGLINLYRHYFYDFGSFLGPSIEHIWVGPCSETELIEIWSQSSYRFTESETSLQITRAEEESVAEAKELSEEMQRKSVQDIKV